MRGDNLNIDARIKGKADVPVIIEAGRCSQNNSLDEGVRLSSLLHDVQSQRDGTEGSLLVRSNLGAGKTFRVVN